MKLIVKRQEPNYLTKHRLKEYRVDGGQKIITTYDSFRRDVGLGNIQPSTGFRKYILEDQGYLCAYCMRRIPHKHEEKGIERDDMKIEHWLSQKKTISIAKKLDITYSNMFGCCMGGEGKEEKFHTCDTSKGDKPFKDKFGKEQHMQIDPTNKLHIETLKYGIDGLITSTNVTYEGEINDILKLNDKNLKRQRELIYQSVANKTKAALNTLIDRKAKNEYLNKEIELWLKPTNQKYKEYCMVAVVYLQSRLR
jgi:uncharacterized protein (TIGR02646 family)